MHAASWSSKWSFRQHKAVISDFARIAALKLAEQLSRSAKKMCAALSGREPASQAQKISRFNCEILDLPF
jgi:hypothetical protein